MSLHAPLYVAVMDALEIATVKVPKGEIKEWYAGFFLMIYLASFNLRFRQIRTARLANNES